MPPSQAGVAAAVASTSRQVGQTLGVAVLGALAGGAAAGAIGASFAAATHVSWWIIVGLGVVVLVLGFVDARREWALETARRTARAVRASRRADEPASELRRRRSAPELVAG